jgi:hypothetical protein
MKKYIIGKGSHVAADDRWAPRIGPTRVVSLCLAALASRLSAGAIPARSCPAVMRPGRDFISL